MEMTTQIPSVIQTGTKFGSNRRPLGSVRRRARARELASAQLSLMFDLDVLESLATIKPSIAKAEFEKAPESPRIARHVYNDTVETGGSTRVHYLDRGAMQCCYPLWSDDEHDLSRHFMCGGSKSRTATYCSSHMQLAYGRAA